MCREVRQLDGSRASEAGQRWKVTIPKGPGQGKTWASGSHGILTEDVRTDCRENIQLSSESKHCVKRKGCCSFNLESFVSRKTSNEGNTCELVNEIIHWSYKVHTVEHDRCKKSQMEIFTASSSQVHMWSYFWFSFDKFKWIHILLSSHIPSFNTLDTAWYPDYFNEFLNSMRNDTEFYNNTLFLNIMEAMPTYGCENHIDYKTNIKSCSCVYVCESVSLCVCVCAPGLRAHFHPDDHRHHWL